MIPGIPAAALIGVLLMYLAGLLAMGLLAWWGWRHWHVRRGTPRPALPLWQWILAIALSILPISMVVVLAEFAWHDYKQHQQINKHERAMHVTLTAPVQWGDVTLPAGSHILRQLRQAGLPLPHDPADMSLLREARFPHPVPIGTLQVNALSIYATAVFELAQAHHFTARNGKDAQTCSKGEMVQFKPAVVPGQPGYLYDAPHHALSLAQWEFDVCFQQQPIALRYWKNDELIWDNGPDYETE